MFAYNCGYRHTVNLLSNIHKPFQSGGGAAHNGPQKQLLMRHFFPMVLAKIKAFYLKNFQAQSLIFLYKPQNHTLIVINLSTSSVPFISHPWPLLPCQIHFGRNPISDTQRRVRSKDGLHASAGLVQCVLRPYLLIAVTITLHSESHLSP